MKGRARPVGMTGLGGVIFAVAAELSALLLLATSGWFLASCALAGAGLLAGFAYSGPSGVVQLFALARIGTNHLRNLLTHKAALRSRTEGHLCVFDVLSTSNHDLRDGEVLDRAGSDVEIVSRRPITVWGPCAAAGGSVLVAVILVSRLSAWAGIWAGIGLMATAMVSMRVSAVSVSTGAARGEIIAAVEAAPELASLGASAVLRDRIRTLVDQVDEARHRRGRDDLARQGTASVIGVLGVVVVLWVLSPLVRDGRVTLPEFVFVMLLMTGTSLSAAGLSEVARSIREVSNARARLCRLDESSEIRQVDPHDRVLAEYPEPGETLTLVGPSGSGKTTQLQALAAAATGSRVTFVGHDDEMFTGTVGSNVRAGDPGLTDEQINSVVRDLGLDPSIDADTRTGVGGRELSRGESRRLVIARAALAGPDVLLVDEPALGLDAPTLNRTLRTVRGLLPNARIIYAAHRRLPLAGRVIQMPQSARQVETDKRLATDR